MGGARRWLVSPAFDLTLFVGPGLVGLALAIPALMGLGPEGDIPLWAWLLLVLGVDVSHVWASLYRVYLNPEERRRRPLLYTLTPLIVFGVSLALYALSPGIFWSALAYVAVFHFIKQQWGFVSLYRHLGGEASPWIRRVDQLALWAGTGVPILYWHAHLPRRFVWFVEGDFLVGIPPEIFPAAWTFYGLALGAYVLQRLWLALARGHVNPGKDGVMLTTWAIYFVGIVALNVDFAFTATNVLLHGIPYLALVWLSCQPRGGMPAPGGALLKWLARPRRILAFVGILLALAFAEELLWDATVWHDRPELFGDWELGARAWIPALFVPLLTVPQATHYVLDGFIWRMDGSNPGLRERLLNPPAPPPRA